MKQSNPAPARLRQQGVALFTALMLLLIVTILGIASVRTGVMESQMANNEELRLEAFQTAQSILDSVFSDPTTNFQVTGGIGYSVCSNNWPMNSDSSDPCNARTLVFPASLLGTVANPGTQLMAHIERTPPECVPCPGSTGVSGLGNPQCATFRVEARYDGTATGQGRTEIREGILIPAICS